MSTSSDQTLSNQASNSEGREAMIPLNLLDSLQDDSNVSDHALWLRTWRDLLRMSKDPEYRVHHKHLRQGVDGEPSELAGLAATAALSIIGSTKLNYLAVILPGLLHLHGRPYSLQDYFPMEPVFKLESPHKMILKCGRQVSKSTVLAAQGTLRAAVQPHFSTVFVLPLHEQMRRFSSNYVRPFVMFSPIKHHLVDQSCTQSVAQKDFLNGSKMHFTFAWLDVERVRGLPSDMLAVDEVQNINWDFIPIMRECLSASKWGIQQYSGTPKTEDNPIQVLFDESSQAEWVIQCEACNYWNIPRAHDDALKMIGKHTVVCAKCGRPLNPRPVMTPNPANRGRGEWVHAYPDRASHFDGWHIPQIIMPMHYEYPHKWQELRSKMDSSKFPERIFYNEVLGESHDTGIRLLSLGDLKRACSVYNGPNDLQHAASIRGKYAKLIVGVDWGGSTAPFGHVTKVDPDSLDAVSFTALAVVGMRPDSRLDVLYCYKFGMGANHVDEVKYVLRVLHSVRGHQIAHDFGGAGSLRETLMIHAGLPLSRIMPMVYVVSPEKDLVHHHGPDNRNSRHYYSVDRTRAIMLTIEAVRAGYIGMPRYDQAKDVLGDLLTLVEDKVDRPGRSDVLRIVKRPRTSDDFAHALTYACMAHWHQAAKFPDFADLNDLRLSRDEVADVAGYWDDPSTGFDHPMYGQF